MTAILRDLVRIPSENTPPTGAKLDASDMWLAFCERLVGLPTSITSVMFPDSANIRFSLATGTQRGRPNVGARLKGSGTGRSLVLSGHIDTVPKGTLPWTRDPFGGEVEGNHLFGRGSNDMKGGVATNLFVIEALRLRA